MPKVIAIHHSKLDATVEVNDDTLADWEAVGWKTATAQQRKKLATEVEEEGADNA